ncbi:virulence RhuM family protein [Bacteroides thetaiotaomicron]|nr:RhuM family protein [Bacteroides thetaiotaomicron]
MNDRGNIVIYQTKDGKTSIDVKLEDETVWLTQAQMAELFQKDRTVIGRHINNVYREGELERDITCAKFAHMGSYSDQQYETAVYNLDVIISVGYRVKSQRGTQFRVWANKVLKEYLIKGYAINQQVKIEQLEDLKNTVRLLSNVIEHK